MAVDYDLGTARGRIEIDSSQLGRTSAALQTVGRNMTLMGVAAVAAFGYVIKSAADFEKQMDAVSAVSGASRREMELLSEQALDLSTKTVFSANEIGGAMEALAKAGIPVQDMLDGATQATISLAAAAGDELPGGVQRAAEIIANAQKTFNAGAEDLQHFADVLVGAAASSTLSVEDLAVSMRYAGPIAAQLGLSLDDLSTVLAVLGDRGIRGSTAGTSLRGVLLSLTPTSDKAKEAMRSLGLITEDGTNKFYDMHGALKPIPEVMQILQDATSGLTEQQKVQAFNTIFQRRAMNSALIMAELGAAGFNEYAEAIAGISASDVAAEKLDNLSGDVLKLRNTFDALIKRAGKPLQEMLRGFVQSITDVVEKLRQLDPQLLAKIVLAVGVAGAVMIAVGAFLLLAGALIRGYRTFIIIIEAVKLLTAAMKLLTLSFLTNPIVLIIAALVALGALLYLAYQRSETFREAFDAAFDKIQPTIEAVVGWIQNFVSLLDELWDAFQTGGIEGSAFSDVLDKMGLDSETVVNALVWLRDALIWLRDAAVTAFDYFADNILPILLAVGVAIITGIAGAIDWLINTGIPALVGFGEAVGRVAQDVAGWFNDNVMPVISAFADLVQAVAERVVQYIEFMWPWWQFLIKIIMGALQFIIGLVDDFIQGFITIWTYLGDNLIEAVTTVWELIKGVVTNALQILKGIIQVLTGLITLDWSTAWEGIKNIFQGVWDLMFSIATFAIESIRLGIETALDLIVATWKIAWDLVSTVLDSAWQLISNIIETVIGTIVGAIQGFFDWLIFGSIWTDAWNACVDLLNSAWESILSAISNALLTLAAWIGALPGNILAWLGDMASLLYQKGLDLITGFLSGITTKAWELISWFTSLASNVLSWIGDMGSTLYSAGSKLIGGLIDGVKDKAGDLKDSLTGLAGDIVSWKGPPKADAVMLTPNGRLIMQGLIAGIKKEYPAVQKLLESYSGSLSGQMAMGMGTPAALGAGPRGDVYVTVNIEGVQDPEGLRMALNDESMLTEIIRAARAGRR